MTVMRIYVSYETTDTAFATQLMTDLREAGAEVITDNIGLEDTTFEQFLSEQLPQCHHLIVVQTPAALQSPRVRAVVDSALKLAQEGQMTAVLRVLAPDLNGVKAQAVPLRWASTPEFDASQDYPRALARLCLHLGIGSNKVYEAPLPSATTVSPLVLPDPQWAENKVPISRSFYTQGATTQDRPFRPHGSSRLQFRQRLFLLSLAMALVLVAVGVTIFIYQRSVPATTLASTATVVPHTKWEERSFAQPALTVFNGQSYVAWIGTDTHLGVSRSSNNTTFTSPIILLGTSYQGPALTVFNHQLYLVWTGTDNFLYIASSNDGSSFTAPTKLGATSLQGPALTVFNNQLHMAWIGTDNRLYIAGSNDGTTFAPPAVLVGTNSSKAPALTVFKNQLYTAWTGSDNLLHIVRFINATTFTGVNTPGGTSSQGIALTVFKNQLYAAWTGIDRDSHLNIANSSDGSTFTPPTILSTTGSQGPALTVFKNKLYMAWTGTDNLIHITIPMNDKGA